MSHEAIAAADGRYMPSLTSRRIDAAVQNSEKTVTIMNWPYHATRTTGGHEQTMRCAHAARVRATRCG
jgi:hypothetical protein